MKMSGVVDKLLKASDITPSELVRLIRDADRGRYGCIGESHLVGRLIKKATGVRVTCFSINYGRVLMYTRGDRNRYEEHSAKIRFAVVPGHVPESVLIRLPGKRFGDYIHLDELNPFIGDECIACMQNNPSDASTVHLKPSWVEFDDQSLVK